MRSAGVVLGLSKEVGWKIGWRGWMEKWMKRMDGGLDEKDGWKNG